MSACIVTENLGRMAELLQIVARTDERVPALHAAIASGSLRKSLPLDAKHALEIENAADSVLAAVALIAAHALEQSPIGHDLLRDLHRRVLRWHGRGRR